MTRLTVTAGLGSAALLLGAMGFQYLGGLFPCEMCIWQRWPHGVAIALAGLALLAGWRVIALPGAAAMLIGAGIGLFHSGVEQGLWEGFTACTSTLESAQSTDDLMNQIMNAPVVRCDEIPWALLGISMAGWNAILSLILAGIWLAAYRTGAQQSR